MKTLEEISKRKVELRELLEDESKEVNLDEVKKEIESLNEEEKEISEKQEEVKQEEEKEERKEIAKAMETRDVKNLVIKEEKKMNEEKRFTTADVEYRNAWAKSLMGVELNEVEKRAVGDAVTTTATTFVAADASHEGINNAGLLIPDSVRMDLMKIAEESSPIYRDITKLAVQGNIDFPYLYSGDDAAWYTEATETVNEGQEYRNITLTGHELAKNIVITWKAAEMTVDSFIDFLIKEINKKMNTALIHAVIYGTGSNQPTGITNGLTAKYNASPVELFQTLLGELSDEDRIGAKIYVSTAVSDMITFYKDGNNNFPYLAGGFKVNGAAVEVDPYLTDNDVVVGNCSNYILNTNEALRIDRESSVKTRKVVYGGYGIFDGNKKPNAFTYGKAQASASV